MDGGRGMRAFSASRGKQRLVRTLPAAAKERQGRGAKGARNSMNGETGGSDNDGQNLGMCTGNWASAAGGCWRWWMLQRPAPHHRAPLRQYELPE